MKSNSRSTSINAKEYVHVEVTTCVQEVRTFLDDMTTEAQRAGDCVLYTVSLDIAPQEADVAPETLSPTNGREPTRQRRIDVFADDGALVLTADLSCPVEGAAVLDLWRDEGFPLVAKTLMRMVEARFPHAKVEMLAEKPRLRSGAPPLACNVWLEEQLRRLPNPEHNHHLYKAWLTHYTTLKGRAPLDPRRSYRAAVAGCLQRLYG